jgi:L-ascorbate metabolism protein UlaG (beta-lactamase superfamily)
MIKPLQQDDELIADIATAPSTRHAFHLWWLGQSGFLVKWQHHYLLFDPYLSDSLTTKYAATDKPHVRVSERCVDPARLGMVNWVTSSHNHTDHLDAETLHPMIAANPGLTMIVSPANEAFARQRLGDHCPELLTVADGESVTAGPFEVHGITAAHNHVDRDVRGHPLFLGFVVKFGGFCLYHSGDTLWHDGLLGELLPHAPIDVAMVPINGNDPARRVAGNLNGTEAAALARAINARQAIPHHYDLFAFNTADPQEFIDACLRLNQPHTVMEMGERLTVEHRAA